MTKQEMMTTVYRQLALDYNCQNSINKSSPRAAFYFYTPSKTAVFLKNGAGFLKSDRCAHGIVKVCVFAGQRAGLYRQFMPDMV